MKRAFPIVLVVLAGVSPAAALVRYVDNVENCGQRLPCHHSIMEAIDAAGAGDVIEIFPGVYHEDVTITDRSSLTLRAFSQKGAKGRREFLLPVIACGSAGCPGVSVVRTPGMRIEHLLFESGLSIVGVSENAVVQGNVFESSLFFSTCLDSIVRDNRFLDGDITALGAIRCVLERNIVSQGQILTGLGDDSRNNIIRANVVAGGIRLTGDGTIENRIELNVITGGELLLSAGPVGMTGNVIRRNTVRNAGIRLTGAPLRNLVELNFVSGSPGDGIRIETITGPSGANVIRLNTSVENAVCDINDVGVTTQPNVWENNRFVTSCGNADG